MTDALNWRDILTDDERERMGSTGFGKRIGLGANLAVVVIDAQQYTLGPAAGSTAWYPSACGRAGVRARGRARYRGLSSVSR
jgi:hypothetical protein